MSVAQRASYQEIKTTVLERIRDGVWPPGTLLPGEIDLSVEFQCARATVNRAMRELADEGIIDRKRKSGTRVKAAPTRQAKFAIPLIREEIERTGKPYRYSLILREVLVAPQWLCGRMGLVAGTKVLHMQCMHYASNQPYQFEDRWINLGAVPMAEAADFETTNPNEWLVQTVPFTDAELSFSAVEADPSISEMLNAPDGSALFNVDRTTWLNEVPVTFARLFFHPGYRMTTLV